MRKNITLALIILAMFVTPKCFAQFGGAVNVALTGTTIERSTRLPVSVNVEAFDASNKRITKAKSNAKDASYFMAGLKAGQTITIAVNDKKYLKVSFPFELPNTSKYTEYSRDIMLVQKVKDNSVRMIVPAFEVGKSELRPGADFILEELLDILKKNSEISFCIDVYPDNNLDKSINKILTTSRGEALRDYFVKNGVKAASLAISSFDQVDSKNPPPTRKVAKGKKYIGSVYLRITDFVMDDNDE